MRDFNKIFVIALPRCATVSISAALGELGIRIAHLGRIDGNLAASHYDPARLIRLHDQIVKGDARLDILTECDGIADYPACISKVYRKLDVDYPGSLFINVRRDADKLAWLRSVERQFVGLSLLKAAPDSPPQEQAFMRAMTDFRRMTFGQTEFDADVFLRAYDRYQEGVQSYFSGRDEALLNVAEISDLHQHGFELLGEFLECEIKTGPFPTRNEHSRAPEEAFLNALEQGEYVSKINQPALRSSQSESESNSINE